MKTKITVLTPELVSLYTRRRSEMNFRDRFCVAIITEQMVLAAKPDPATARAIQVTQAAIRNSRIFTYYPFKE